MRMGDKEEKLVEQLLRDGVDLPEHLANPPDLLSGLELFYHAFRELSTCRALGMSVGPIPWTATNDFCIYHTITGTQRADLFYHVENLDVIYRDEVEKKAKIK